MLVYFQAERLMEALELYREESAKLAQHEQDSQKAGKKVYTFLLSHISAITYFCYHINHTGCRIHKMQSIVFNSPPEKFSHKGFTK